MNKQQRYLSLLLLANVVSGTKAMELVDAPNKEEQKDKFAILKPQLSAARKERLEMAIDWIDEETDGLATYASAYLAALELEIDAHPLKRGKLAIQRKKLWSKVKTLASDAKEAQLAVEYLTGSEDEQEMPIEATLMKCVHRRDKQLKAQAIYAQTRSALMDTHKTEEEKQTEQLNVLRATKNPLEEQAQKLALQELDLLAEQNDIALAQEALQRMVERSARFTQEEPLLADTPKEKLVPAYHTELSTKKEANALRKAQLFVARNALETQIAPLLEQEKQLNGQLAKTLETQGTLAQSMERAAHAQALAQTDKNKILGALDEMIENCTNRTERAVLKVARAQADGTYSKLKWAAGYYK